jgi:hypothetical protein
MRILALSGRAAFVELARGAGALGDGVSLGQRFDFLRRATPSGGFGVTSARQDERAPKTPW